MASKTKSISFKEKYSKQYDFLLEQDNPSGFVCELIKKHMEGENDFESKVKDVLIKYLGNQPQVVYQAPPMEQHNQVQQVDDTQEKIDEIEDPW